MLGRWGQQASRLRCGPCGAGRRWRLGAADLWLGLHGTHRARDDGGGGIKSTSQCETSRRLGAPVEGCTARPDSASAPWPHPAAVSHADVIIQSALSFSRAGSARSFAKRAVSFASSPWVAKWTTRAVKTKAIEASRAVARLLGQSDKSQRTFLRVRYSVR